jgi:hypothetical protein
VKLLYRIAYSREASNKEVQQALEFLEKRGTPAGRPGPLTPLAEFAHVILNSNEFLYIN